MEGEREQKGHEKENVADADSATAVEETAMCPQWPHSPVHSHPLFTFDQNKVSQPPYCQVRPRDKRWPCMQLEVMPLKGRRGSLLPSPPAGAPSMT